MELAELTSFVGRVWEMEEVRNLTSRFRMVTLTGTGGCGKSRLAYRLARSDPPQRVTTVELASVNDPTLLPSVVSQALGSPDSGGRNPKAWLVDYLTDDPELLVWDNCEHLAESCADLASLLLKSCPEVRLLCTSRQAIGVPGEAAWVVPSLSYPAVGTNETDIDRYESVRLFVDRSAAASPGFNLTKVNSPAIAAICSRLEGIPLAIELAAARTNVLAPAQILPMLDDALALLRATKGFVLRQRTLESTLDWSYGLLSETERVAFRRAGVFAGAFDLDATAKVCGETDISPGMLLDAVASLVDRSLIIADTTGSVARYHMLEPVRQYALKLLRKSGEEPAIRNAHLEYYVQLAREAEPHLMTDPDQSAWLARVDQQLPEMRSAMNWALIHRPNYGADLATRLGWFWWLRAYSAEGRTWLDRALESCPDDWAIRAAALRFDGQIALREGDNRRGAACLLRAIPLYRQLGDEDGLSLSFLVLGAAARSTGHVARASVLLKASLAIEQKLGKSIVGSILGELGVLAMVTNRGHDAEQWFREATEHQRSTGDAWGLALTLANLAELFIRRADSVAAAPLFAESLQIMQVIGDPVTVAQLLDYAGMVAISTGDATTGLRLMGVADSQRQRLKLRLTVASRALADTWLRQGDRLVGPRSAARALNEGRNSQILVAVIAAQTALAQVPEHVSGLSPREHEVALLIGEGLTNREIAERLFISIRTAEGHVVQILNKLAFQRRSQIASWISREAHEEQLRPKTRSSTGVRAKGGA